MDVRVSYGNLSGKAGIVINTILCCVKLVLGFMSGAISIVADAIHNLADAGSSIVTLLGFKLSAKPADLEHPYGHGRIEYVSGLCISAAIILVGVELLKGSVEKLLMPEELSSDGYMMVILLASILLQLWLGRFNRKIGRTINSAAIEAASADNLNDCVATTVVVIGLGVHYFWGWNIDGAAGIFVAAFILHSGWCAARDTLQPLLGQPPDPELVKGIQGLVLEKAEVCGVHDLIIHDYGPGRIFASLHAEVPSTMNIMDAHEVMDELEVKLRQKYNIMTTVHMDPVVIDDPETNHLRGMVEKIVQDTHQGLSMHDFRTTTTFGKGRNLIFDVVIPPECGMRDRDIIKAIQQKIQEKSEKYHPVIRIDRFYC